MTVIAMIEPIPADHTGVSPGEVRELSVEAETCETSRTELYDQLPEGWRIINLRRA